MKKCLSHYDDDAIIIIRKSITEIMNGDVVASALCSYFEYWHNVRLSSIEKERQENRVAIQHGDEGKQISLYQFHTVNEIEETIQIAKKDKIRESLRKLVDLGIVSIHNNPNPKYGFDKTKYYLFHPAKLQKLISAYRYTKNRTSDLSDVVGYDPPESTENTDERKIAPQPTKDEILSAENRNSIAENSNSITENRKTITYTTPNTTSETEEEKNKNKKEIPDFINEEYLQSLSEDVTFDHEGQTYVIRSFKFLNSLTYEEVRKELNSEKSGACVRQDYCEQVKFVMNDKWMSEKKEEAARMEAGLE